MDELKPCPCGCDAKLVYESGESYGLHNGVKYTSIHCSSCSFRANDTDDWNTRADGWVSVDSEIKPADMQTVLIADEYDVSEGFYSCYFGEDGGNEGYFSATGEYSWKFRVKNPTHWMPLPQPPKAVR